MCVRYSAIDFLLLNWSVITECRPLKVSAELGSQICHFSPNNSGNTHTHHFDKSKCERKKNTEALDRKSWIWWWINRRWKTISKVIYQEFGVTPLRTYLNIIFGGDFEKGRKLLPYFMRFMLKAICPLYFVSI